MWALRPTRSQKVRQALVGAAILLVAGLVLIYLRWSLFWQVWCFGLGLGFFVVALLASFEFRGQ